MLLISLIMPPNMRVPYSRGKHDFLSLAESDIILYLFYESLNCKILAARNDLTRFRMS